jgi:hypothetical protein
VPETYYPHQSNIPKKTYQSNIPKKTYQKNIPKILTMSVACLTWQ